jgi:hypothetical protein
MSFCGAETGFTGLVAGASDGSCCARATVAQGKVAAVSISDKKIRFISVMILRYLLFSLLIFRHKSTDNLAKTLAISSKLIEISYSSTILMYNTMSLPPFPYVNNIPKKVNQAKTPEKWGKKRLRIFP